MRSVKILSRSRRASGEPQYDASNGTMSRGNIERVGPGNISQDYFRWLWNFSNYKNI